MREKTHDLLATDRRQLEEIAGHDELNTAKSLIIASNRFADQVELLEE